MLYFNWKIKYKKHSTYINQKNTYKNEKINPIFKYHYINECFHFS